MQIYGTLTVLAVSRSVVLESTFNGGYAGMANLDPNARIDVRIEAEFVGPPLAH